MGLSHASRVATVCLGVIFSTTMPACSDPNPAQVAGTFQPATSEVPDTIQRIPPGYVPPDFTRASVNEQQQADLRAAARDRILHLNVAAATLIVTGTIVAADRVTAYWRDLDQKSESMWRITLDVDSVIKGGAAGPVTLVAPPQHAIARIGERAAWMVVPDETEGYYLQARYDLDEYPAAVILAVVKEQP